MIGGLVLVASGYVDDLNQIIPKQDTHLKVGDVGVIDDLKIEVLNMRQVFDGLGSKEGAAVIMFELRVENIGKFATDNNVMMILTSDAPSLYYYDRKMAPRFGCYLNGHKYGVEESLDDFVGFPNAYPGTVKQGWICFDTPETIELNKTVLNTHGLKWDLG